MTMTREQYMAKIEAYLEMIDNERREGELASALMILGGMIGFMQKHRPPGVTKKVDQASLDLAESVMELMRTGPSKPWQ